MITRMSFTVTTSILATCLFPSYGFTVSTGYTTWKRLFNLVAIGDRSRSSCTRLSSSSDDALFEDLNLTPELTKMLNGFKHIADDKIRYKNLVYLANELAPVGDDVRIPQNKVPGCLSTVHVTCDLGESGDVVQFRGDSDGILTKGLLAMLVRGFSGCTPKEIEAVDPKFIQVAGIAQTLTPGRNNGFLNMIDTMKRKAREVIDGDADSSTDKGSVTLDKPVFSEQECSPLYTAILTTLTTVLKPEQIELVETKENNFKLLVVAEAFDEMAMDNRKQLIGMLLGELLTKVEEIDIDAKSLIEPPLSA